MDGGTDWAAVRDAYERTGTTTREIARTHGISVERLHEQKRIEGWRSRRPNAQRTHRGKLINRLLRLLDGQVREIEELFEREGALDRDAARLLESLTRTMDRLVALEDTERASRPGKRISKLEAADLRKRLADRMMRVEQGHS